MTDPVDQLANDAQRLAATERLRWIPRELLVGDIGVVLELAHRLDDVDAPTALTGGELGAPDRGVKSCAEVDVVHHSAGLKVRLLPGHQQLAYCEVCLCSVEVHARLVHLEGHRLPQVAHAAMLATSSSGGVGPIPWASVLSLKGSRSGIKTTLYHLVESLRGMLAILAGRTA